MQKTRLATASFYLVFLVIPVAWWLAIVMPQNIWAADWYSQATFWGRLTAIAGLGLFAGNLLLSSRLPLLDSWFSGLDNVYSLHRSTGKLVWYLLALHAAFIGLRWIAFGWPAITNVWFTLPAPSTELLLGRLAFIVLTLLVATTIYLKLKYETKKLLHYWLASAIVLGALHAFLLSDTLATHPAFGIYLLGLTAITLISFTGRTLLGTWLVPTIKVRVTDVVQLDNKVTQIDLTPRTGQRFPDTWLPGQFAFLRLKSKQWRYDDHPFSIVSAPSDGKISFAAKAVGDFTTWLPQLSVGTEAQLEGPYGGFSYLHHTNRYQVWIAGGIGITPFIAMANHLAKTKNEAYSIQLVYSVANAEEAVFASQLAEIAQIHPSFSLVLWDTSQKGYFTADWLTPDQIKSAEFMICGPQPMMRSIEKQLHSKKVNPSRIHMERFKLF